MRGREAKARSRIAVLAKLDAIDPAARVSLIAVVSAVEPPLVHLRSVRTRRVPQHPARRHKAGDQSEVQYLCITL